MKIIGLTKVRNEEKIIQETLNHWGKICTGGIIVVDDKSDDKTVEICKAHPAVKEVVEINEWDFDRERAEWRLRQLGLEHAQNIADENDWFVYFDADERLYFDDWNLMFQEGVDAIAPRLYDIYITPEDAENNDYNKREWIGPEFRTIVFFFKNSPYLRYNKPDQRIVDLKPEAHVPISGIVKHFGKGLSVKHWDETCDYYIDFWPKYSEKWKKRKGKAIKKDYISDFGNKLIKFKDVLDGKEIGIPLESQTYGLN